MRIEHIAMYVNELEKARDFFVKYLGASPGALYSNEKTGFRSYFLSFDGGARLEIMSRPGIPSGGRNADRTGFVHAAFSVGSRERVDELTAVLKAAGYAVVSGPRTTGDGYYESCVAAEEGCLIELTV